MKYFLDTEFIEDGRTIDLVSVALVAEDGRSYYAISSEFDAKNANDWVKENVLDYLPNFPRKTRDKIRHEIEAFVFAHSDDPEFWGYYSDYDWVAFCQLWGAMVDLPRGLPMYCHDLNQLMHDRGFPHIPFKPDREHDALSDARWNRRVYAFITDDPLGKKREGPLRKY